MDEQPITKRDPNEMTRDELLVLVMRIASILARNANNEQMSTAVEATASDLAAFDRIVEVMHEYGLDGEDAIPPSAVEPPPLSEENVSS